LLLSGTTAAAATTVVVAPVPVPGEPGLVGALGGVVAAGLFVRYALVRMPPSQKLSVPGSATSTDCSDFKIKNKLFRFVILHWKTTYKNKSGMI
jgi:hypothetical protein